MIYSGNRQTEISLTVKRVTTLSGDIDFHNIRSYRGTRHGGFEESSVQLFRAQLMDTDVIRVNGVGGDGGVEAFAVLPNGCEAGLQAKFFDRLDQKQWKQISRSVTSALDIHLALTEYYIAVPLALLGVV